MIRHTKKYNGNAAMPEKIFKTLDPKKININAVSSSFKRNENGDWILPSRAEGNLSSGLQADFNRGLLFHGAEPFPYQELTSSYYDELTTSEQKEKIIKTILEAHGFKDKYELLEKNYSQTFQQLSYRFLVKKFLQVNQSDDNEGTNLAVSTEDTSADFYQLGNEIHLKVTDDKFVVKVFEGGITLDVKVIYDYVLTDGGAILQSVKCESTNQQELEMVEAFITGSVEEAKPFHKEVEKKVLRAAIKSVGDLNTAQTYFGRYLDLLDPNDRQVQADKKMLSDIKQAKPKRSEHKKYIDIIKNTASLAAGETKKTDADLQQDQGRKNNNLKKSSRLIIESEENDNTLTAIKSAKDLTTAKELLKKYLDSSDPTDNKVKIAKRILVDIDHINPAPKEHKKYLNIVKNTASLASGETRKIGTYIHQAKKVHNNHFLKTSMLMLAGVAMIGLSVGLAILSHGASTPVSIAGIHLGVTLITGLVHAKAAIGFGAALSSIGLFGRSISKSTSLLQENMYELANSAPAA